MLTGYPDHQPLKIYLNHARLQCPSAAETYKTHVSHMYMATKLPYVTQGNISNHSDNGRILDASFMRTFSCLHGSPFQG